MNLKKIAIASIMAFSTSVFATSSHLPAKSVDITSCTLEYENDGKVYLKIGHQGRSKKSGGVPAYTYNLDIKIKVYTRYNQERTFIKDISTSESLFDETRVFLAYSFEPAGQGGNFLSTEFQTDSGNYIVTRNTNLCPSSY